MGGSSVADIVIGEVSWERIVSAVEKVRERLLRATTALEKAGVPYAVIGGHAVAEWVTRANQCGVRNTPDVNILLRRVDFDAAKVAMEAAGFVYQHAASIDKFLDGKGAKARDAVHVLFAGEKVREEYVLPTPEVTESEAGATFRVLSLEALVRMKLTSNRDKDRTHVRDFIDVGLVDSSWPAKFPPELASRLQHILDTPDG
ncbi:MAG: hypothetical protein C0467_09790 [Planctomycetaceae bacterium]|nr:hypothetical protein [Planctomycetaceae bacterium]